MLYIDDGISSEEDNEAMSSNCMSVCPYVSGCCRTLASQYTNRTLAPSNTQVTIPITKQAHINSEIIKIRQINYKTSTYQF